MTQLNCKFSGHRWQWREKYDDNDYKVWLVPILYPAVPVTFSNWAQPMMGKYLTCLLDSPLRWAGESLLQGLCKISTPHSTSKYAISDRLCHLRCDTIIEASRSCQIDSTSFTNELCYS